MTGIQALERNAPSRPMTYGQCERIEFEYDAARDVDADRQLPGDDRGVDRSDDRPDADGGGLRQPHRADGGHRPGGVVGLRGG